MGRQRLLISVRGPKEALEAEWLRWFCVFVLGRVPPFLEQSLVSRERSRGDFVLAKTIAVNEFFGFSPIGKHG